MARIYPFRGLRYADDVSLQDVVTPPYDVIDGPLQQLLAQRHAANFVKVDLNPPTEQDSDINNPYTRAAGYLETWEQSGVLTAEESPAFYAYSQSWMEQERLIERKGMIALLKLEPFERGVVLPHEYTLKGPKQDRLALMRETRCGLSQIFLIYQDADRLLESILFNANTAARSWKSLQDADAVTHRFRPVTDPESVRDLQALFEEKNLLIADGHHRYETALGYQQEERERFRAKTGYDAPEGALLSDYVMVFVTNMDDPGLQVYPTHRILYKWPAGWDQARFEARLQDCCEPVSSTAQPAEITFCYRAAGSQALQPFRLKEAYRPKTLPPLLDTFDAALLEEIIFKGLFQQTGEQLKQAHLLGFYRNEAEIDALWAKHEAVAGFYLQAPSVQLVHQICESGHRMPQKSTYFYPKILSGLVMYPYRAFLNEADGQAFTPLTGVTMTPPLDTTLATADAAEHRRVAYYA